MGGRTTPFQGCGPDEGAAQPARRHAWPRSTGLEATRGPFPTSKAEQRGRGLSPVYPHTTAPSRANAGPCQPKRVLSMMRFSGSANAVNGTRMTRWVSPGSIALTGDGVRQSASTPVTSNRDGGMCRRGSRISGSTTAASTPVSSAASRIAVAGGPASPSCAPPGNATSPAWSRSLGARCCSRTSGPSARSVAIRIRTAACRSAAVSGAGWFDLVLPGEPRRPHRQGPRAAPARRPAEVRRRRASERGHQSATGPHSEV